MSLALRPSFSLTLACPSKVVLARLYERLGSGPFVLRRTRAFGQVKDEEIRDHDHFVLTVVEAEQRLYSPWLTVEVSPAGEGGAQLLASFSPHPSVWTLFAFAYLALATLFLFSLCFAFAVHQTGGPSWVLGVSAATALLMILLWGVSLLGQHLSRAQMAALKSELEASLTTCSAP